MRLGFVGGGVNSAVGQAHFLASRFSPKSTIEAGSFSRDPATNIASAEQYGVDKTLLFDNWERFVEKAPEIVDAVCILTPSDAHSSMIPAFLDKGLLVFSEKPGSISVDEIKRFGNHPLHHNLRFFFTYTGFAMLRELRELIQIGSLGKIFRLDLSMNQDGYIRLGPDGQFSPPQQWRLVDPIIPMVYLDLGLHLTHLATFLSDFRPTESHSFHVSKGRVGVIDTVDAIGRNQDAQASFRFSKSSLGEKNSLSVQVFGERGSAAWKLSEPDRLLISDEHGVERLLRRGSEQCLIAGSSRYNHFKIGHPVGYVEALSELYTDFLARKPDEYQSQIQDFYSASELSRQFASLSLMAESR